jgi:integrase
MPKIALNASLVRELTTPEGKLKYDFFDITCKGLLLEVRATGGKTYYFRYQDARGKTRQLRLARTTDIELSQARQLVSTKRTQLAMGVDPAKEKEVLRQVPTFADFIEKEYLPYVMNYKRSWKTDVSLLKNHLLPPFGKLYLDEISRKDMIKLVHDRRTAGAAASSTNRLLILMRYIFNLALRWEVPGIKLNPTKNLPLMQENNKCERYLSVDEAKRLYEATCQSENPLLRYIIPMLILTGARKREVLDAKWKDFDIQRCTWRIPLPKSGKARHVPLSDGALAILRELPQRSDVPYVFANQKTREPYASIFNSWNTARKRANLPDVRVHDLRHSFASMLINQGRSLYEVQHILGHTQVKTTQRYAHLSNETLLEAANAGTHAVESVMRSQGPLTRYRMQRKALQLQTLNHKKNS